MAIYQIRSVVGDRIHACWLPKLFFSVGAQGIDCQSMYRSIYSFFDPRVRSFVLRAPS